MRPTISYRIWFSPRSGSTLLCKGLEETGIAGKAGEFFTLFDYKSLCEKYEVNTYNELRERLWKEGTSSNGVFGIKIVYDKRVINEIRTLRFGTTNSNLDEEILLSDIFPNCKNIFLTRRNKIRQAVSWWKAIKDNVWHIESNQQKLPNDKYFYKEHYDFAALSHLFKEATLRECAIQAYFTDYGIQPLTVVYEDLVNNFENTIRKIISFLELNDSELIIKKMPYQKTADSDSEKWVQQFRADIQKEMNIQIW